MPIIANLSVFNKLTADIWVAREFANLSKSNKKEDIVVVSQWQPDREAMARLGVPTKNIFMPDDYLKPKLAAVNSIELKLG